MTARVEFSFAGSEHIPCGSTWCSGGDTDSALRARSRREMGVGMADVGAADADVDGSGRMGVSAVGG
jgi:hypothetical protein